MPPPPRVTVPDGAAFVETVTTGSWYAALPAGVTETLVERRTSRLETDTEDLWYLAVAVSVMDPTTVTGTIWRWSDRGRGWQRATFRWLWAAPSALTLYVSDPAEGIDTSLRLTHVPLAPGVLQAYSFLLGVWVVEPPDFAASPAPFGWYAAGGYALHLAFLEGYTASYAYSCSLRRGYVAGRRAPWPYGEHGEVRYRLDMAGPCLMRDPLPESRDLIRSGYLLGVTAGGELVGLHYHGEVGRWFPIRWSRRPDAPVPTTAEVAVVAERALVSGLAAFTGACSALYERWLALWRETAGAVTRVSLTEVQLSVLSGVSTWDGGFTPYTYLQRISDWWLSMPPPRIDWPLLYDDYWRRQVLCRLFEPEVRADPEAVRKLHELTGIPEEEIAHTAPNYALLREQLQESLAVVGVAVPEGW